MARKTREAHIALKEMSAAQLPQNARGAIGQFTLEPYTWVYQSNPNELKLRTAVKSEQWLIDNTTSDDQLLLWVDGPCE